MISSYKEILLLHIQLRDNTRRIDSSVCIDNWDNQCLER